MNLYKFVNNINIISLGWGCAVRTELIRRYFPEQPVLFFDYLGNFDGLDTCTQIILNDFQDFQDIEDFFYSPHPKWNTDLELKPISLCFNPPGKSQQILVSRRFPDLAFYHYEHTDETLQSFQRKGARIRKMLREGQGQTIFVYYRQYDEPINGNYAEELDYSIDKKLSRLESEAIRFRNAIEKKYPDLSFKLIALIMEPFSFHELVTPAIDAFLRQKSRPQTPQDLTSTRKIIFDRVLASVAEDKGKFSAKSWGRVYRSYLITNPISRSYKACLTIPFKLKKIFSAMKKHGAKNRSLSPQHNS
jgi:hypothetical protein